MSRLVALLLCATLALSADAHGAEGGVRLAALGDGVPQLLVRLVNSFIKGRIDPRRVDFKAPAGVEVLDLVLFDADGHPVGRAARATAELSIAALFTGDVVIKRLVLEQPRVIASVEDGKLNLLDALSPKKQGDGGKPPDAELRIDDIVVEDGGFRFTHEDVVVTADGVAGRASFALDMRELQPVIRTSAFAVESGSVKLPDLDVDMKRVRIQRFAITGDLLELDGATGQVAGADVVARGTLRMKPPGRMEFSGSGEGPPDLWPARLKRPPFTPPSFRATWKVEGPYEDPRVSVAGRFGDVEIAGYRVGGGDASILVDKQRVRILSSKGSVGGGSVEATGEVRYDDVRLDLDVKATRVALKAAIAPFEKGGEPAGAVSGRARVTGRAAKEPLSVVGTATPVGAQLYGVRVPGETRAAYTVRADADRVLLDDVHLQGGGVDARVTGPIDLKGKALDLSIRATVTDPQRLVTSLPDELRASRATFTGAVAGPFASTRVLADFTVEEGDAYGVPVARLAGELDATAKRASFRSLQGVVAGGAARGAVDLAFGDGAPRIEGEAAVRGADLAKLKVEGLREQEPKGLFDATAKIRGTTKRPRVDVVASGPDVRIAGETLGAVRVDVAVDERRLVARSFSADGPIGRVLGERFEVDFQKKTLAGVARVPAATISRIAAAERAQLTGTAAGVVVLAGTFDAPTLAVDVDAKQVRAGQVLLGDGKAAVRVGPQGKRTVVTVSTSLGGVEGAYDLRAAYRVQDEVVHAEVRFTDVDLGPATREAARWVQPMQGVANGVLVVHGPVKAPTIDLRARSPALVLEPARRPAPVAGEAAPGDAPLVARGLRTLGEVALEARLQGGRLAGHLCAFPGSADAPTTTTCKRGERVQAAFNGTVDLAKGAFAVDVEGWIDEPRVEDFVAALAREDVGLGARARVVARIARANADAKVIVGADASVRSMRAALPGAPEIFLVAPFDATWSDERLVLAQPARFATRAGDVNVVVAGSVGADRVDLELDGTVALALLKLATQEIASAAGTADAQLAIRGAYDQGVRIEGRVAPRPGATIQPRSTGERIAFDGGTIRFFPSPLDPALTRVELDERDPLLLRVGDGATTLRGSVDVRTARAADETWVSQWDLRASGAGLDLRTDDGPVEIAFDAALEGTARAPRLVGRVEITDGNLRRRFQLRNFVLEQGPERPSDPLWQRLQPFGLADLTFDVETTMQNVRARAELSSFQVDASLRGDLRLAGSLRVPQLTGAVEVEEGYVDFPRARFEIQEMQLEFPTTPEGRINPEIRLVAKTEVAPELAGTQTELPIDLALEGDLDRMRLDLVALDARDDGREFTRADLLSLVVFGRPATQAGAQAGTALRAFSSELTGTLTNEVEEQIARRFATNIELDVLADEASREGGVRLSVGARWRMGRRLQLEGEQLIARTPTGGDPVADQLQSAADLDASTRAAQQLRLRLLLWDHIGLGEDIAFEGRFARDDQLQENTVEWRLSWRLWER